MRGISEKRSLHGIKIHAATRPEWLVLYGAVAVLYLFVAWREWLNSQSETARPPIWHGRFLRSRSGCTACCWFTACTWTGSFRFGFAHALSATLWITQSSSGSSRSSRPRRGLFSWCCRLAALTSCCRRLSRCNPRHPRRPGVGCTCLLAILAYSLLRFGGDAGAVHGLNGTAGCTGTTPAALAGWPHFLDRLPRCCRWRRVPVSD